MTNIDPMVSLTVGYESAVKYRRQLDAVLREMVRPELGYSIDAMKYEIVVRLVTHNLGVGGFSIRWSTLETLDDLPIYVRRLLLSALMKMAESHYLKG